MAKQMNGVSLKGEEEKLYVNKSRGNTKQYNKRFEGKYHNCGKKDHKANISWLKKRIVESNIVATFGLKENNEDDWDVETFFAIKPEEITLITTTSSKFTTRMTGLLTWDAQIDDKKKLQNLSEY